VPAASTYSSPVSWAPVAGDPLVTVDVDGALWTPPRREPPLAASSGDPVRAFYRRLPPQRREPVDKALVKVLHPDAGGDLAVTQGSTAPATPTADRLRVADEGSPAHRRTNGDQAPIAKLR
jgi:hypothetical protein